MAGYDKPTGHETQMVVVESTSPVETNFSRSGAMMPSTSSVSERDILSTTTSHQRSLRHDIYEEGMEYHLDEQAFQDAYQHLSMDEPPSSRTTKSPDSPQDDANAAAPDPKAGQRYEPDDETVAPDDELPKYQLRPQSRDVKSGFTSTWIDQDQTGDYDPSEEFRKARLRQARVKQRARDRSNFAAEHFDEDDADDEARPKVVYKPLVVLLKLHSEGGRAKFEEIVARLPAKTIPSDHVLTNGYRLRKRHSILVSRFSDCRKSRFEADLPDNLANHPIARGCWGCAHLGHDCSLLRNEHSWPCETCLEDNEDCKLITPPIRKRACERCKSRRSTCSYTYTLNHGPACHECGQRGESQHCVAGPHKDAIHTRVRYDRDWVNDPPPPPKTTRSRNVTSCTECREAGRQCSIITSAKTGRACTACISKGDDCTIEHLVPQAHSKSQPEGAGQKRKAIDSPVDSAFSPKVSKFATSSSGTTKTIKTKFCHPIRFNYEDQTNGQEPCHFCADTTYPMLGLPMREVEVIDWEDGRGLEEMQGGHKGDSIENTRICASCTFSRMTIALCPAHEMRPIPGVSNDALESNAAMGELLSGSTQGDRRWCGICPSLAHYECHTDIEGTEGCGLTLCEDCMLSLTGQYDGDLQTMLPSLKDEPTQHKMFGLRADFELLKQDGLLMRYVLWSSQ